MSTFDVIVVGGGVVGPAIAYGLTRQGRSVALLDEDDEALRAARANFGLVWVQGKGLGMPRYAQWTLESSDLWPAFAAELHACTGIDVAYRKPGGLTLCLSAKELEDRRRHIARLREQAGLGSYDCEFLDRSQVQRLVPSLCLGEAVVGASYCRHDGLVNPLALMRALHVALQAAGGAYLPGHPATAVRPQGSAFVVETPHGGFAAGRVVLAAGHGIPRLAGPLGMHLPIRPERGQLVVTERVVPLFSYPMSGIEQTGDGTVMLGASNEDVGFDDGTSLVVTRRIVERALAAFPGLAGLRMVRTWAGLRVLTPDKHPIYEESPRYPGAYVTTCHSGVTLAAVHATRIAHWIASSSAPPDFDGFSSRRFRVQAHT